MSKEDMEKVTEVDLGPLPLDHARNFLVRRAEQDYISHMINWTEFHHDLTSAERLAIVTRWTSHYLERLISKERKGGDVQ